MPQLIEPKWDVADRIRACFSTRQGGVSHGAYATLNLGLHVEDRREDVLANRALIQLPSEPVWLDQVHSSRCIRADDAQSVIPIQADAAFTNTENQVLAVMTADCLPILLTTVDGNCVAVIHAGWRGLANGIIEETFKQLPVGDWRAWIGPAIGPCHYEVGIEVRTAFESSIGFTAVDREHWMMNLFEIAKQQLLLEGVKNVSGGNLCTFCDRDRFFSYRRDGVTGRMAGFIWIDGAA